MSLYTIDTASAIEELENAKLSRDQAKAIVMMVAQSHEALPTKSDLREEASNVRTELKAIVLETKTELEAKILEMRTELEAKILETRTELEAKIQATNTKIHETKMELIKWQIGIGLAVVALIKTLGLLGI